MWEARIDNANVLTNTFFQKATEDGLFLAFFFLKKWEAQNHNANLFRQKFKPISFQSVWSNFLFF